MSLNTSTARSSKRRRTRTSLQADLGVHAGGRCAVVEPARRHGLGLRVELHHLFAVGTQIAELGAARSGKAEKRHRYRNGHVDSHLAHVDFALKFARDGAALSKNARAIAEGIVVDERDRLVQAVHAYDYHHGSEYLGGIDLHLGGDRGKYGGADEVSLFVAGHFDGAAVQFKLGAFPDAVFHEPEDALFRALRDHRTQVGGFLHTAVHLEGLGLGDDIGYPLLSF